MAVCTVTGVLRDPAGIVMPETTITIHADRITGSDDGAMLPVAQTTASDGSGAVAFDLLPGMYRMRWRTLDGQGYQATLGVPHEASANLADLLDAVSGYTPAIDVVAGNLAIERDARQIADAALRDDISAEISARASADALLGTRVDTEQQFRQSGDLALSNRIDGIAIGGTSGWSGPFPDVSAGISNTTDGEVFSVADSRGLRVFRNNHGVADELTALISADVASSAPYQPFASRAAAQVAVVPAPLVGLEVGGLRYIRDPSGTALQTADGARWSPAGVITTGHFGQIGDPAGESAIVQAALDWAKDNKVGRVELSAPLWTDAPVVIPGGVLLDNPEMHTTTMLPGCKTAYRNRIGANGLPEAAPAARNMIVDANNVADAWHGFLNEGSARMSLDSPQFLNFTAVSTGSEGAGHAGADGGKAEFSGYDNATGLFMTSYRNPTSGQITRGREWVVNNPYFSNCRNFVIATTVPEDTAQGANFGAFYSFVGYNCYDMGIDFRFGEQCRIMGGRVNTTKTSCKALIHIGDSVTTLMNVGCDGVMQTAYFHLAQMEAGQSITQVRVWGTDTLSAPVPFNTSVEQTMNDLHAAMLAGPAATTRVPVRSKYRPEIMFYTSTGGIISDTTVGVVVTSNVTKGYVSGPTSSGNVTALGHNVIPGVDRFGTPYGMGGNDILGVLLTQHGWVTVIEHGGNGPANRFWFSTTTSDTTAGGEALVGHLTSIRNDKMAVYGGRLYSRDGLYATRADGKLGKLVLNADGTVSNILA